MLKLFHLPNMRYIGLNMELSDLLMRRQKKYLNIAEINILQIWIRYHTKFIVTSMNLHVITLLLKRNKRC